MCYTVQDGGGLQVGNITVGDAGRDGDSDRESTMCQMGEYMVVSYCRWTVTTTMGSV